MQYELPAQARCTLAIFGGANCRTKKKPTSQKQQNDQLTCNQLVAICVLG